MLDAVTNWHNWPKVQAKGGVPPWPGSICSCPRGQLGKVKMLRRCLGSTLG